ncbi:hypothetical protein MLD38_009624 [Melastoma candidum]|uniref:Uncharacterized protein n=1 Tax=Melastoma candidum TaxID=119954 RepID=A0ACB9S6N5_9MYRT|nr:hypothetical protein MLD38_009624 [Melastoma candidum]
MQRVPTGLHRQLDDEWVIDFPKFQSSSSSPRRSVNPDTSSADCPQHHLVQTIGGRRDARRSWIKENWVHTIPLVVLLSLFILWWFSSPVEISIKQGGFAEALRMVIQTNNTADQKVELAILASLASTPMSKTSPIVWSTGQAEPPSTNRS